jgi:hypothetical protein
MTSIERVGALVALGFARSDAKFLATVLPHGGCFVQRQYRAFMGVKDYLQSTSAHLRHKTT